MWLFTRGYLISFHVIHELALKSDEETAMTAPLICDGSQHGFFGGLSTYSTSHRADQMIFRSVYIYMYMYMYIYMI